MRVAQSLPIIAAEKSSTFGAEHAFRKNVAVLCCAMTLAHTHTVPEVQRAQVAYVPSAHQLCCWNIQMSCV
eukprot:8747263-Ditylum_brightwellii.AAC.1